jgi:hypothetical protein
MYPVFFCFSLTILYAKIRGNSVLFEEVKDI